MAFGAFLKVAKSAGKSYGNRLKARAQNPGSKGGGSDAKISVDTSMIRDIDTSIPKRSSKNNGSKT